MRSQASAGCCRKIQVTPIIQVDGDARQLNQRLAEQAVIAALSQHALEGTDPSVVMQKAAEELADLLHVDAAGVLELLPQGEFVLRVGRGAGLLVGSRIPNIPATPAGLAALTDGPVFIEDLPNDSRFDDPPLSVELGMISGINVVIPARRRKFGVLGVWSKEKRTFTTDDANFLQAVANVIGGMIARTEIETALADALEERERQLGHSEVLGRCAATLLGSTDDSDLKTAMGILMDFTRTSLAWVSFNNSTITPPGRSRHRIYRQPDVVNAFESYWDSITWTDLPSIRARLAAGHSVSIDPNKLTAEERKLFEGSPTRIGIETDIPIKANGEWVGTLSFVDDKDDAVPLGSVELGFLETAASMIGSWWQRVLSNQRLQDVLAARERSLQLEKAVASCAQALSGTAGTDAMSRALSALVEATDATSVFVEKNVEDEVRGLCSQVVASMRRDGAGYDPEYWDMMPWSAMPTSFAELNAGREMIVVVSQLEGPERETYINSAVRSEIDLPIYVDGRWVGIIGCADERTERGWDEERELLKTVAQIIAAAWHREETTNRLEKLVQSKDEFIAAISHELRTPLTAVVGLARTLQDAQENFSEAEVTEFISTIAEQATEVSDMVQDLLVVARSDIGHVTLYPQRLHLVSELDAVLRGINIYRKIRIIAPKEVWALADPLRVRQILRNLFTNAGRYGGLNVQAEIAIVTGNAVIEVRDDGKGIDEEDRVRIFEPYQRAHHDSGQPASVGLGLTVSRQLAELMGGSLVYNYEEGWSRFTLTLPCR